MGACMTTVLNQIITIIAEQGLLDVAQVNANSRLSDLGIDSLGIVETVFAIEETFDVAVPFNANQPNTTAFDISTVGAIAAAVEGLIARKAA
jgi:acyl carrier protein